MCTNYNSKNNKEKYLENLHKKQEEHLNKIKNYKDSNWKPCLHDQCTKCYGTGFKFDGSFCVHNISCSCPKCTTMC